MVEPVAPVEANIATVVPVVPVADPEPATDPQPATEPEPLPATPKPIPRTWTTNNGKNNVVAVLVNHNETHVQLERADSGKRVTVPIAALCDSDRRYIEQLTAPPMQPINDGATVLIGKVTRVLDGDTVHFTLPDGEATTIRLEGVDAPEKDQRLGPEARTWLTHQLANQTVRAEVSDKDRYGRSLGHLYVSDRWLNQELIAAGLAWHYAKYNQDVRLAQAQQTARGEELGLWVDARKVAPWDWRNGQRVETALPANVPSTRESEAVVFITETGTKYHRQGCRYLDQSQSTIPLSRAESAYEPCKVCKP